MNFIMQVVVVVSLTAIAGFFLLSVAGFVVSDMLWMPYDAVGTVLAKVIGWAL